MVRQLVTVTVLLLLAAAAHAGDAPPVAIFPLVGKGKVVKAVNRAVSKMERIGGAEVLTGKPLRDRLGKNSTATIKKCRAEAACLAELGKRAGVAHLVAAAAAKKGKTTEITFVLVAVDPAAVVLEESIEVAGVGMVEESVLVALDALVKRAGQSGTAAETVATVEKEPPPLETESRPAETDEVGGTTGPDDERVSDGGETQGTEEIVAAPTDGEADAGGEVAPPPPVEPAGGFNPSWKSWAGVGGVAAGAVMLGLGVHFGNVADDLRDLNPRATQLEVVAQEKDQNAAAVAGTVLLVSGITFLAAGLGALAWDWLDGVPVISTGVSGGGAQVGVTWSW